MSSYPPDPKTVEYERRLRESMEHFCPVRRVAIKDLRRTAELLEQERWAEVVGLLRRIAKDMDVDHPGWSRDLRWGANEIEGGQFNVDDRPLWRRRFDNWIALMEGGRRCRRLHVYRQLRLGPGGTRLPEAAE